MSTLPPPRTEEEREAEEMARRKAMEELADRDPDEQPKSNSAAEKPDTTEFIHQDFLMDQEKTVGEVLQESAMEIKSFFRFEVGQELPGDED